MSEAEFFGARLEKDIMGMIEKTAEEEKVDKTKALKELVLLGRQQYLLQKYLELYRVGKCSVDKAAELVGITVAEMMQEAVKMGIKSDESIEEYKEGLKLLQHK
ncbi:hypothetical protein HY484_04180 [Candidatus Woesearchaeota archaeon]|nr:hypothetical protein [Candidatus Woesearchaeota archaeon]